LRLPNVLVLRSFSMSFSLCVLRVGLAFGDPALIAELAKVKDSYNVSTLGLAAAEAALEDYASMESHAARVCASRDVLTEGLRARGMQVLESHANFVLARRPGADMGVVQRELKAKGVLVRHFDVPRLRDALRITVGTPEEVEALLAALG
jgi:histidinol-phosphate aminotransferase